jgi:hypothetical protein
MSHRHLGCEPLQTQASVLVGSAAAMVVASAAAVWPINSTRASIWAFVSGHPDKMNLPGHSLMCLYPGIRANRREAFLALYPGRTHLSQISLLYPGIRKLPGPSPGPWSLVPGPWSLVPGPWSWSLVHGPWSLVHGPWSLVHGPWSLVPGPWSLVPGPWSLVPGP